MCGWIEAVKEVYRAGGNAPVDTLLRVSLKDIQHARNHGMLTAGKHGGRKPYMASITDRGRALVEGRLERFIRYVPSVTGGRAVGSCWAFRATWLAALPRPNEIRVSE